MTSVKTIAAIAVIAVVVCAIIAYAIIRDDGGGDREGAGTIGDSVAISDMYTIEQVYTDSDGVETTTVTTYTVTEVSEGSDVLTVTVTEDGVEETRQLSTSDFLDNVRSETPTGQYQRTETITTDMGDVACDIYYSEATVGNSEIRVSTLEWIGQGTNVIYQTEITLSTSTGTEVYRTTLQSTNMIGDSGTPVDTPSISGSVRTDLQVGDYIEFTQIESDGDRDVERYTIVSIDGDTVWYTDDDYYDRDDWERTTVDGFLSMLVYSLDTAVDRTENISTAFGDISCEVHFVEGVRWLDHDETLTVWVGESDGVIYKMELAEVEDGWFGSWTEDVDAYHLTGTSLFSDSSPSGGDQGSTGTPSSSVFGIEVVVGDSYTIEDGNEETVYEVIAIDGDRLIVRETETEGWDVDVDVERMSVNEFLSEIMITDQQLSLYTQDGTGVVDGVQCTKYTRTHGNETVTLWVGANNVVWLVEETEGWGTDTERITSLNIQALA